MKKILIVEDERPLSVALEKKLTLEGYDVITAFDGVEGLSKAESESPDLILLDIIMPNKDGMSMLEEMRATDWGREISVILLTNLSEGEKVTEALKSGVHDYLVKSDWRLEDVAERVKSKLK